MRPKKVSDGNGGVFYTVESVKKAAIRWGTIAALVFGGGGVIGGHLITPEQHEHEVRQAKREASVDAELTRLYELIQNNHNLIQSHENKASDRFDDLMKRLARIEGKVDR